MLVIAIGGLHDGRGRRKIYRVTGTVGGGYGRELRKNMAKKKRIKTKQVVTMGRANEKTHVDGKRGEF